MKLTRSILLKLWLLLSGVASAPLLYSAPLDLFCAPASDSDKMVINEIGTNGVSGPIRFIEIKVIADQVDVTEYTICLSEKGKTPDCQTMGTSLGEWNDSGYMDDQGPDFTNPTTFNDNTWLTYEFGNIDPNESEIVLLNSANEVVDFLCFSKQLNCNTSDAFWSVPVACTEIANVDPSSKSFTRSPDGSGTFDNSTDPPTTGGTNDGEIPTAEICTDIAAGEFVPAYIGSSLIFTGDHRVSITDIDGEDIYRSGSARSFTTATSLDADANIQGGIYPMPALVPASFPGLVGTVDLTTSSSWASGDWNVVDTQDGTLATGGAYRVNTLIVTASSTLQLNAGDYFIDQLIIESQATITAMEPGVNLHISTNAAIADDVVINTLSNDPADLKLQLYPGASLTIDEDTTFTGNILAAGNGTLIPQTSMTLGDDFVLTGSLFSEGDIIIDGNIDIIYNAAVMASQEILFGCATLPTPAAYFQITSASNALTCTPQSVNISAYYADDTLAIDYTGTVSLLSNSISGSDTGDWLDSGQVVLAGNATADDGWSSLDFTLADAGSIDVFLAETHANTINIDISDAVLSISESVSFDPNITFATAGFQWLDGTDNPIPSATIPNLVAGTSQDVFIRAVTTDPATGQCSNLFADTTDVTLDLGSQCVDPGSCYAGQRISAINNSNAFDIANPENQIAGQSTVSQLMRFNANSTTSLNITSSDVGKMELIASYDLLDATGTPTGETISGSTTIVSKPDHLTITGVVDTSSNANPGTQTAVGGTAFFVTAGDLFHVQVEGRSSGDIITPSFGRETTIPQPIITPGLVAPIAGTLGSISQTGTWAPSTTDGAITFSTATTGISYSEVGAMNLTANLADYMTVGNVNGVTSGTIGRFIPNEFTVSTNVPMLSASQASCGFVYRGQDLLFATAPVFSVTALNSLGAVTQNYDIEFFTLPGSLNPDAVLLTDSGTAWSPPMSWTGQWIQQLGYDGVVNLQLDSFNLDRNSVPTAGESAISNPLIRVNLLDIPLSGNSLIHDNDGVCYSPGAGCSDYTTDLIFSGMQWLYGRATLTNSYGSETRNLDIPVNIEYWDGSFWQPQVLETSCTNIFTSDFSLGSWIVETGIPTTSIASWSGILTGTGIVELTAPGAGNTGTIPILLAVPDYLKYHWDDDYLTVPACSSSPDICLDNPAAKAKFGIFEGRAPILYRYQIFR